MAWSVILFMIERVISKSARNRKDYLNTSAVGEIHDEERKDKVGCSPVTFEGGDPETSPRAREFRHKMREARPDLKVFRKRPKWQKFAIRVAWRILGIFGVESWSPRRERQAGKIHPDGSKRKSKDHI